MRTGGTHVVVVPEHDIPRAALPVPHPQLRHRRPERHELGRDRPVRRAERRHVEWLPVPVASRHSAPSAWAPRAEQRRGSTHPVCSLGRVRSDGTSGAEHRDSEENESSLQELDHIPVLPGVCYPVGAKVRFVVRVAAYALGFDDRRTGRLAELRWMKLEPVSEAAFSSLRAFMRSPSFPAARPWRVLGIA